MEHDKYSTKISYIGSLVSRTKKNSSNLYH